MSSNDATSTLENKSTYTTNAEFYIKACSSVGNSGNVLTTPSISLPVINNRAEVIHIVAQMQFNSYQLTSTLKFYEISTNFTINGKISQVNTSYFYNLWSSLGASSWSPSDNFTLFPSTRSLSSSYDAMVLYKLAFYNQVIFCSIS